MRREAGYDATLLALKKAAWQGEFDPLDGVLLHESMIEMGMAAE